MTSQNTNLNVFTNRIQGSSKRISKIKSSKTFMYVGGFVGMIVLFAIGYGFYKNMKSTSDGSETVESTSSVNVTTHTNNNESGNSYSTNNENVNVTTNYTHNSNNSGSNCYLRSRSDNKKRFVCTSEDDECSYVGEHETFNVKCTDGKRQYCLGDECTEY